MSSQANDTTCPECNSKLQKCLIQQNYAITICVNEKCQYPFRTNEVENNLSYISDKDILDAAKNRLEHGQQGATLPTEKK